MARRKRSDITKKYIHLSRFFRALQILILLLPIIVYAVMGFVNGEVTEKITLGISLTVALILFVINIVFKFHLRSCLWIMVLGIYFCIDNIMPLLLIVAIGTIVDEFLLTPLYKSFKNKATINKEIDKRLP